MIKINTLFFCCWFSYGVVSAAFLVGGLLNSIVSTSACTATRPRIVYVFPTYMLGCWLGEVP